MKKWEDIVKDKLEGYESALPEGSLAEFRARRNQADSAAGTRRFPLAWVLVPALAAGLAAVLLLRNPAAPEDGVQIVQQPSAPVALAPDSSVDNGTIEPAESAVQKETAEPVRRRPLLAQAVKPSPAIPASNNLPERVTEETATVRDETGEAVSAFTETENGTESEPSRQADVKSPSGQTQTPSASPFIPNNTESKQVKLKVGPAAGVVAGGGLLAALLTTAKAPHEDYYYSNSDHNSNSDPYLRYLSSAMDDPLDGKYSANSTKEDIEKVSSYHHIPVRAGLSTRFPLSEKLYLTTGLDYSRYQSEFSYSSSGLKNQIAQYIGVPVRLDWTLASNRWLDVYLGGGLEGDFCVGATLAGSKIPKDGLNFSLLGAGGIQFNMTERLGLYVEPELSYLIPSKSQQLVTYRTQKPLMFSVATGFRITLGK